MKKALVLYSGGLDSRLAVQILKEQNFKVEALHFILPFGCGCCKQSCNFNFTQKSQVKLTTIDVTKNPLLKEYLKILKKPKHGIGSGINPCKDCKIFIFKKAKEYADKNKIEVIATGEVLGQRPMSQLRKAMQKIDEEIGYEILRPLSAKLLEETIYEKKGLINREKLFAIKGRGRKEQMKLAETYKIKYPTPGGGCFLCESAPSKRLKFLLEKNLITEKTLPLTMIGRHFFIENSWLVVARGEIESQIINKYRYFIEDEIKKPSVYSSTKEGLIKAKELQKVYSTGASEEQRNKFKKYKI
ncbi:MAG: tRNA 4-thiouridine(8) synthase ThiI [archaeon]